MGTTSLAPHEVIPLADVERDAIERALAVCDGNITVASKKLGIGRTTLYRKMITYKLAQEGQVDPGQKQTPD
jgi:transcriptional regulator of acetoin/glycerol metabolism